MTKKSGKTARQKFNHDRACDEPINAHKCGLPAIKVEFPGNKVRYLCDKHMNVVRESYRRKWMK